MVRVAKREAEVLRAVCRAAAAASHLAERVDGRRATRPTLATCLPYLATLRSYIKGLRTRCCLSSAAATAAPGSRGAADIQAHQPTRPPRSLAATTRGCLAVLSRRRQDCEVRYNAPHPCCSAGRNPYAPAYLLLLHRPPPARVLLLHAVVSYCPPRRCVARSPRSTPQTTSSI